MRALFGKSPARWAITAWLAGMVCFAADISLAASPDPGAAAALRASHAAMTDQLRQNQFGRALVLESAESSGGLKGDIHAVVDHPFAAVAAALNDPARGPAAWCDVLILHINTKYCRAGLQDDGPVLNLRVG